MIDFEKDCQRINKKIKRLGKNYIPDGVINPKKYQNSPLKLLWVLKDPNSSDTEWSMIEYLSINEIKRRIGTKDDTLNYKMYVKLLLTSYGIVNKFPDFSIVNSNRYSEEIYSVSEQIAYINVKKSIGGSEAIDDELKNAYREHRNLLLEQIKIANPNIIIFGNVLDLFENDLQEIGWDLKQAKKFTTELYPKVPIFYQCEQNRVIVDAYHPACRRSYEYYYTSIIEGLKSIF